MVWPSACGSKSDSSFFSCLRWHECEFLRNMLKLSLGDRVEESRARQLVESPPHSRHTIVTLFKSTSGSDNISVVVSNTGAIKSSVLQYADSRPIEPKEALEATDIERPGRDLQERKLPRVRVSSGDRAVLTERSKMFSWQDSDWMSASCLAALGGICLEVWTGNSVDMGSGTMQFTVE